MGAHRINKLCITSRNLTLYSQALYKVSKNAVANCPTIDGPTALELPKPKMSGPVSDQERRSHRQERVQGTETPQRPTSYHTTPSIERARTIYRDHGSLPRRRDLGFLYRVFQIGDESIDHRNRQTLLCGGVRTRNRGCRYISDQVNYDSLCMRCEPRRGLR